MWKVVELDFDDKLVVLTDGETEIKMELTNLAIINGDIAKLIREDWLQKGGH